MLNFLMGLFGEIWKLLLEMSPYILFGLLIAGFLYIIISKEKIYHHLAKNNFSAVLKASLFGIPLPLCSCGVIPVAVYLRKEGAGKGPTLSFLISTPTTGVDSILATYSLMGLLFAIIRPIAAFVAGVFAGIVTNLFDKEKESIINENSTCAICDLGTPHSHSLIFKIKTIFKYAFYELVEDFGKWLIIGIVVGGLIAYLVPAKIVEQYLSNPLLAYPLMIAIGLPMYVCATASIPIAAVLIMKGMSPGAGLIFLILGPATNVATLTFVAGKLGKKTLVIYIVTLVLTALFFAILLDLFWQASGKDIKLITGAGEMLPEWLKIISSLLLLIFILNTMIFKSRGTLHVPNKT